MGFYASRCRLLLVFTSLIGCRGPETVPQLRGPLAPLVSIRPPSLDACDVKTISYVRPFWRAPYRTCRDTIGGRLEVVEVDADSLVTELVTSWDVPAADRQAAFATETAALTERFGLPFRCAPTQLVWRARDSVRVALLLQPNTDVFYPGMPDSISWRISRYARLGPLLDAWWCRPARDSLGARRLDHFNTSNV